MRTAIRAFLVSDTGDPYEDTWQTPIKVFTSKKAAIDFARDRGPSAPKSWGLRASGTR